ncbi:MAG: hypothetical protein U0667_10465 [Chloroflexota bacterium]
MVVSPASPELLVDALRGGGGVALKGYPWHDDAAHLTGRSDPAQRDPARTAVTERDEPSVPERIRVLLVDDHQVVRNGLRTFLSLQDDIEVVGEASDGAQGVARPGSSCPTSSSWTC